MPKARFQPRGRSARPIGDDTPINNLLDELDLLVTEDKYLVCLGCKSFLSKKFHNHFEQGCPSRTRKYVNRSIVERVNRELQVRDFCLPTSLPCPPFPNVRCINGFKCDYCMYCTETIEGMRIHLKSKHRNELDGLPPGSSKDKFSKCCCQPTLPGPSSYFILLDHRFSSWKPNFCLVNIST